MPVVVAPGSALLTNVQVEQEVTWYQGGVYYAGRIRAITPADHWRADYITLDIECQDYTSLLNDEICTSARSVVETDAQRISWLLQSFDRRGITAAHVQTLYSSMPAQDFTGVTLNDAIKAVLAFSNGGFYIDDFKDLHTFILETNAAPFGLSDLPDGVTTFGYNSFQYPADSVDLRNAVYGVPVVPSPGVPDSATEQFWNVNAGGGSAVLCSFKTATHATFAQVGALGPFATGSNTTVSPLFGQATVGGNMLTASVSSATGEPATTSAGWVKVVSAQPYAGQWVAIWVKANCGNGEIPPTFTSAGGTEAMFAQLGEFSGGALTSPQDQSTAINAQSIDFVTITMFQADVTAGDLILMATRWPIFVSSTATFTQTFNNSAVGVHMGDSGGVAQLKHASFNYAIIPAPKATWYTNDSSIGLYGRREASFSSTVTTQSALDALGAAYLSAHSLPLSHSSLLLPPGSPAGLTAGMTIPVTNSLYGLTAAPFRIQSVDITYPADNLPQFALQFADPAVTVTTQLVALQSQISAVAAAASVIPAATTLGTLGYIPSTTLSQAGIVAAVDLSGMAVTVTVGSGRRIKITAQVTAQATVATDLWDLLIVEGSTTLHFMQFSPGTTSNVVWPPISVVLTPTAGSHTYKLQGARGSGTGSFTASGQSVSPAFILVEDIGT